MSSNQNQTKKPALRSQSEFFVTGIVPIGPVPGDSCSVCTEPLKNDVVHVQAYSHNFHDTCIVTWLSGDGGKHNRTCRNCREVLYEAAPATQVSVAGRYPVSTPNTPSVARQMLGQHFGRVQPGPHPARQTIFINGSIAAVVRRPRTDDGVIITIPAFEQQSWRLGEPESPSGRPVRGELRYRAC
jgi:hypothetical protein